MSLLVLLTLAVAHGIVLMIDMVGMLLIIRIICLWKPVTVLAEFDLAGKPLVDRMLCSVNRFRNHWPSHRALSIYGQFVVAWILLVVTRLFIVGLVSLLSQKGV